MLRIDYGKNTVKNILRAYAYFRIKEDDLKEKDETKFNYLVDLFNDLIADVAIEPNNNKHLTVIAEEGFKKVNNQTATIRDIYTVMGFDLISISFLERNKENIPNAEEDIQRHQDQLKIIGRLLRNTFDSMTDKQIIKFHKECARILINLENECAQKMKEHIQKKTGQDVTIIAPHLKM